MSKPELLIEVFTDPMCPWCWCGEAQLEKTLSSDDFAQRVGKYMQPVVKLRPYVLDTRLPATSFTPPKEIYDRIETTSYTEGSPPTKRDYYSKKFTNLDAFNTKITDAATKVGLPGFEWLTDGKVGATWLAHRLLWKALQLDDQKRDSGGQQQNGSMNGSDQHRAVSLQEQLAMRLYRAFHSESMDISDIDVLARIASKDSPANVDAVPIFATTDEARKWLQGDDGHDELIHQCNLADMNGVQSVPYTIVQDGSDHSSEVLDHNGFMKMFEMQAALYK